MIRQLIHHGYLAQDITQSSVLKLTEAARPLLRSELALPLAVPRIRAQANLNSKRGPRVTNYDKKLFIKLKELRKSMADELKLPPYIIFSDATLTEMAAACPLTEAEMLAVNGVGKTKYQRYGQQFVSTIENYLAR